jgi:hypothetical protein
MSGFNTPVGGQASSYGLIRKLAEEALPWGSCQLIEIQLQA